MSSLWSKTRVGKHRTRTLPHVIFNDPDWFYWAYGEEIFKGQLLSEALLVRSYARTILPPKGKAFRYNVFDNGEFTVSLVEQGTENSVEKLDLEFPRKHAKYDREKSYEPFMDSVQKILFGEVSKPYVKREVCERFFSSPKNFGYQARTGGKGKKKR